MAAEITILIAEDHPVFRLGLRQIIEEEPGLKVLAEAGDGEQAMDLLLRRPPQVAVLDIDMPVTDGLAMARRIRDLGIDTAVILLTGHKNERLFNAALDEGVRGFILKDCAATEIVTGIRVVASGKSYITPLLTDFLLNRGRSARASSLAHPELAALTPTELKVLRSIADFKSSKQIADDLFISVRTVDRHRANIAAKLKLSGSNALVAVCTAACQFTQALCVSPGTLGS